MLSIKIDKVADNERLVRVYMNRKLLVERSYRVTHNYQIAEELENLLKGTFEASEIIK